MKNTIKARGMLAVVLAFGMFLSSCASVTWNAPVTETGTQKALKTALDRAGSEEVASYTILFNVFHLGRETFQGLVVAEVRRGKTVDILRTTNPFATTVKAYAREPGSADNN